MVNKMTQMRNAGRKSTTAQNSVRTAELKGRNRKYNSHHTSLSN